MWDYYTTRASAPSLTAFTDTGSFSATAATSLFKTSNLSGLITSASSTSDLQYTTGTTSATTVSSTKGYTFDRGVEFSYFTFNSSSFSYRRSSVEGFQTVTGSSRYTNSTWKWLFSLYEEVTSVTFSEKGLLASNGSGWSMTRQNGGSSTYYQSRSYTTTTAASLGGSTTQSTTQSGSFSFVSGSTNWNTTTSSFSTSPRILWSSITSDACPSATK